MLAKPTAYSSWPRRAAAQAAMAWICMISLGGCVGLAGHPDVLTSNAPAASGTTAGHGNQPGGTMPGTSTSGTPEVVSPVHLAACNTATKGTAFVPQPGVTYVVTPDMHTGLQITSDSLTAGALLTQGAVTFTMDQLFTIETTIDGHAMIRAYHSGKLLAADANGSITQSDSNARQSQWQVVTTDGNRFAFVQDTLGGCLTLPDGNQTLHIVADKKGWAGWDTTWGQVETTFHPTWFYDWGSTGSPNTLPARTEFVPMVWGYYGDANGLKAYLASAAQDPNVKHVLGYNEPDNAGQANLDVNLAISTWPWWESMGKPIGSPAGTQSTDAWMTTFMGSVQDNVSFVTVHWYGGTSAQSLQAYLQATYDAYQRPIWITEFCPADWGATSPGQINFSQQNVTDFMAQVIPILDSLPYVQRYSWYESTPTDNNLGQSTLLNTDGSLTGAGKIYANYPFVP